VTATISSSQDFDDIAAGYHVRILKNSYTWNILRIYVQKSKIVRLEKNRINNDTEVYPNYSYFQMNNFR
jgi:hypothetical protein